MKMYRILGCLGIMVLLAGCYGSETGISTLAVTTVPTQKIEPTFSETSVPTQKIEITSSDALPTTIQAPTYPPETRMQAQCLQVGTTPVSEVSSSGVLILQNQAFQGDGSIELGTILLNMKSGEMNKITMEGEGQIGHIISPNRELVAYQHVIHDTTGKVVKNELVIASAEGQPLSVMPWEEGWILMPAWLDNERLVINFYEPKEEESTGEQPATLLVLNPFSGERHILNPDFPRFLNTKPTILSIVPYWEGWSGAIYDPTLTRAIYPRFIGDNDEMYTYAIWDVSERRLIATLDEVFSSSSAFNGNFPMPKWSPDGSRFVFQGFDSTTDPVNIELYEVNRDGQAKQLTQLAPVAYVWESSLSWSPDGRYIAMFLAPHLGAYYEKARVAVLDTVTLDITDYCVSVKFSGDGYGRPGPLASTWSPDSHEFIITDWYEKDHRRLILINLEKNSAVQIADDMEPAGWMVAP